MAFGADAREQRRGERFEQRAVHDAAVGMRGERTGLQRAAGADVHKPAPRREAASVDRFIAGEGDQQHTAPRRGVGAKRLQASLACAG